LDAFSVRLKQILERTGIMTPYDFRDFLLVDVAQKVVAVFSDDKDRQVTHPPQENAIHRQLAGQQQQSRDELDRAHAVNTGPGCPVQSSPVSLRSHVLRSLEKGYTGVYD
jgi:hypothetical protein